MAAKAQRGHWHMWARQVLSEKLKQYLLGALMAHGGLKKVNDKMCGLMNLDEVTRHKSKVAREQRSYQIKHETYALEDPWGSRSYGDGEWKSTDKLLAWLANFV